MGQKGVPGRTLVIESVQCGDQVRKLDVSVEGKQATEIELQEQELDQDVELDLSVRCLADLVVPHSQAVIRHAGRREKLSMETLLGLDDLVEYPWVKKLLGSRIRARLMQ